MFCGVINLMISCIAFMSMILCSAIVYLQGLNGITYLVRRFELTIPNERTKWIHFTNMALFVVLTILSMITEIVMLNMYGGTNEKGQIETNNVDLYLHRSFTFELCFTFAYMFEFACSIIMGYLIIAYSKDNKANLYIDPITNLEVPSLVFAYNQQ